MVLSYQCNSRLLLIVALGEAGQDQVRYLSVPRLEGFRQSNVTFAFSVKTLPGDAIPGYTIMLVSCQQGPVSPVRLIFPVLPYHFRPSMDVCLSSATGPK